jgi:hypothetical protein
MTSLFIQEEVIPDGRDSLWWVYPDGISSCRTRQLINVMAAPYLPSIGSNRPSCRLVPYPILTVPAVPSTVTV